MPSIDILDSDLPPGGLLITAAGGIGDAILFAHVFSGFAALAKGGETVTLVFRADAAKAGFLFNGLAQVRTVDFIRLRRSYLYRRRVFNALGRARFRRAISVDYKRHPKLDEALLLAADAPETAVMKARPWAKYDSRLGRNEARFTALYDSGPAMQDKILRWAGFLQWLGGAAIAPVLNFSSARCPPAATVVRPLIILAPFSAEKLKQSPASLFGKILEHLRDEFDIVLTGASGDLRANPQFEPLLAATNVTFDDSSFEALAPRLCAASLVIAADTATMHLAVAYGAPTLCLASAAYVGEIVPYAVEISPANAHFLYEPMDCQGCLGACIHPPEAGMYPCVAALDADKVIGTIESILHGSNT
ncbi:MAG: glycosyltransferase family 9 protein [Pseudomonadota bacterium]|nr:glycosyltransferase family 9 protein [Pseudomonadota bacterium]